MKVGPGQHIPDTFVQASCQAKAATVDVSLARWIDRCYTIAVPSTIKQTAFRFTPEDLTFLDAIQGHLGMHSRTEALRVVLRSYARAEGIEIARPRKGARKGSK